MKKRLKDIIMEKSVFFGDFTLTSGKKSSYYIDARISTLYPESAYLIGNIMFNKLSYYEIDAVGGYSIGADPIISAISLISHIKEKPIPAFIIRKEGKNHGREKEIEGNFTKNMKVAIVDDVVTTGGSLIKGIKKIEKYKSKVECVLCIIDRLEGGRERIESLNIPFHSLYTIHDLDIKNK